MNVTLTTGSILDSDAEALVCPVNCVGVMGKGLALDFKNAIPGLLNAYKTACRDGLVESGRMFSFRGIDQRYAICFPTKRHWRESSTLECIEVGLYGLLFEVGRLGVASVAVPALGCGLGGLSWEDVGPLISKTLFYAHGVRVTVYPPHEYQRGMLRPKDRT